LIEQIDTTHIFIVAAYDFWSFEEDVQLGVFLFHEIEKIQE
jgi:hypothetical protein